MVGFSLDCENDLDIAGGRDGWRAFGAPGAFALTVAFALAALCLTVCLPAHFGLQVAYAADEDEGARGGYEAYYEAYAANKAGGAGAANDDATASAVDATGTSNGIGANATDSSTPSGLIVGQAAKNYFGYSWEDLPFVAGENGLTADGTPGITVSKPAPFKANFASPATYRGQYYSQAQVTGAKINARYVITINVPKDVLDVADDKAKAFCDPDNKEGKKMINRIAAYKQAAVNWAVIQSCFDYADKHATSDTLYRVKLPAGTYAVGGASATGVDDDFNACFHMHGNIWFDLTSGTKLMHASRNTCLIRNGYGKEDEALHGYEDNNIILEGGTIQGLTTSTSGHNEVAFCHASNVVVRNVKFQYCYGAHHLELAGVNGATVTGCEFSQYAGSSDKEAIQLDVCGENSAEAFPAYDYSLTRNVVIANNKFHDLSRGVGTHYVYFGYANDSILIQNNSFANMRDEAIFLMSFNNVAIRNNTMSNCRQGICIAPVINNSSRYTRTGKSHGTRCNYLIENNNIATSGSGSEDYCGMVIYGNNFGGTQYPLANVMLKGNVVNASYMASIISNATNITMEGEHYAAGGSRCAVVRKRAQVNVANSTFASGPSTGLSVESDSSANIGASTFSGCGGQGMAADHATVSASGCTFSACGAQGLSAEQATVSAANCTFANNGAAGLASVDSTVNAWGCAFTGNRGAGASDTSGKVSVSGCSFNSNGSAGYVTDSGALWASGSTFNGNAGIGFKATDAKASISNSTFGWNGSHGIWCKATSVSATGSNLSSNGACGLMGYSGKVTLKKCTASRNRSSGVNVRKGKLSATSTKMSSNRSYGLYASSEKSTVKSCTMNSNAKDGLRATKCSLSLSKSTMNSNKGNGANITSKSPTLSKNTFSKNKKYGAQFSKAKPTIKSCKFTSNKKGGIKAASKTTIKVLQKNQIKKNKGKAIVLTGKSKITKQSGNKISGNKK